MENEITATLVANAGILLEYNHTRILIDGIHYDRRHYFSPMSDKILNEFIEGKGQFANIDYLLFTHNHVDHFSPKYTMKYLVKNTVRTVFLPKAGDGKFTELKNYMQSHFINARLLDMPLGKRYTYLVGEGIGITVFNTVHMGDQFSDVENYCYVITMNGKNILFIADGDYKEKYFKESLKDIQIDTVFMNPLYLNNLEGRTLVSEVLKPNKIVIYHIPFETDDKLGFRKMVKRDIEKYEKKLPSIQVIEDELQKIIL